MFYEQPDDVNNLLNENIHIQIPYNKKNIKGIIYKFIFNKITNRLSKNIKILFYIKKVNSVSKHCLFYNNVIKDLTNYSNDKYLVIELELKNIKSYEYIEFKCIGDKYIFKKGNTLKKNINLTNINNDDFINYNFTKWFININKNFKDSCFKIVNFKEDQNSDKKIRYYKFKNFKNLNTNMSLNRLYNKYFINNQIEKINKYNINLNMSSIYSISNDINNTFLEISEDSLFILDDVNLLNGTKFKFLFTNKNLICYFYNNLEYKIYFNKKEINYLTNKNIMNKVFNVIYFKNSLLIY